jgi:hypothetical protein
MIEVQSPPQEKIAAHAALVALLSLALILRLVVTFEFPNINHPDEIYQTIEQALRLTTGAGIVPGNSKGEFALGCCPACSRD